MGRVFLIGLSLLFALSACSGEQGAQGEQGEPGEQGEQGEPGPQGEQGEPGEDGEDGESVALGYIGSEECGVCHARQHASWVNSGHPYKVNKKEDVVAGTAYPSWVNSEVHGEYYAVDANFFEQAGADVLDINGDTFPNGGWDDVTYVIGGYGWKTRFMGVDGYIITGAEGAGGAGGDEDDRVQYNFPLPHNSAYTPNPTDAGGATYHTGEQKPYTCGTCHTTGWIADTDAATDGDLSDNQDGLEGIHGTWEETGVGCEACHGPGAGHADNPYEVATQWNPATRCGNCHIRNDVYEIDTSGGFIKHHEQYEEVIQGKHSALQCTGCHDPHEPVRFGDTYVGLDDEDDDPNPSFQNNHGVRVDCTSCHFNEMESYDVWASNYAGMENLGCEDCHMPKATKSAVKVGDLHGDTATHIFGINSWVDPITNPEDSTTGPTVSPANPYISLDWACGSCHLDEIALQGSGFYDWALDAITENGGVHGNVPAPPAP